MSDTPIDTGKHRLLIVDDEKNIRFSLSERFKPSFAAVHAAANGTDAMRTMENELIDVVLLDQRLQESGEDGLEVLAKIRERHPHVVVIIMTAFGQFEQAVTAARLGCFQYLSKPLDLDQLELVIRNGLATKQLEREVARLRKIQQQRFRVDLVMGENAAMARVAEMARKVARSATSTVLVRGETGVGKELVAQLVHFHSPRSHGPFVEVNCSAIHENLMETELFGHERGAFTDARRSRAGLFEMADGGTLFLDEIGELSPGVQAKLLRVLESRRFRRVGGTEEKEVDVRVVAATNRDLKAMAKDGGFREDLYYRVSVIPIVVPPLRERSEDIPPLVKHFVDRFNSEFHVHVRRIHPDAMALLEAHPWDGNVRELRNVIERVMLTLEDDEIRPEHLYETLGCAPEGPSLATLPSLSDSEPAPTPDALFASGQVPTLTELERWAIHRAMAVTGNNKTRAAELLGISRQTLRMKLKDTPTDAPADPAADAHDFAPPH